MSVHYRAQTMLQAKMMYLGAMVPRKVIDPSLIVPEGHELS